MSFEELKSTWKKLGEDDPLWVVVSHPDKKGGKWDEREFFETGQKEVESLLRRVEELGIQLQRGTALDFGCGVGRLSQALCAHFQKVVGIDISPTMIDRAVAFNRHSDRCEYRVNGSDDLNSIPDKSFDFVLSFIVLQHMHPRFSQRYLREFIRVLKPGGLVVFQLPSRRAQFYDPQLDGSLLKRMILSMTPYPLLQLYRRVRKKAVIDMFGVPREKLVALFDTLPCRIQRIDEDSMAGKIWESYTYYIVKT